MRQEARDVILIVDDIDVNRMILAEMLKDDYDIFEADSGTTACRMLFDEQLSPTVVLLDIMMPDIDGFEVLDRMKNNNSTKNIPVLFITAADSDETESQGLKSGAADYITKPFNTDVVRARVDNHISLARYRHRLEQLVAKKAAEVTRTYEQTLEILATIIEYRNLESGAHIRRTTLLTECIIAKMLESEKFRDVLLAENVLSLIKASALHDIGKIGISDGVLLKPGKLSADEFDIIKTHTSIGSQIIDSISASLPDNDMYLKYAKEICHFHHERWDGKGYPNGLKGEDIPLSARIISIVDVYDALVNPRCYKAAYPYDVSIEIITEGSGTQFDPEIIALLPQVSEMFKGIEESYLDK
ncbi:MAG: response regulator [Oscillospiraceae bacterium]|nr:response regulator [Oscillospiraceae bacterium]